jgi:hypothetical protein
MRPMSKSPVRAPRVALAVGRVALPPYASRYSKHTYTQPQLFALLTLRHFLKTDCRGLVALLAERGELRRVLGLGSASLRCRTTPRSAMPSAASWPGREKGDLQPRSGRHRCTGVPRRPDRHGTGGRGGRWADGHQPQPAERRPALARDAEPTRDAAPLSARTIPSTVARGECVQPPQASAGLRARRAANGFAAAGTRAPRPHAQPHAPQAWPLRMSTGHQRLQDPRDLHAR